MASRGEPAAQKNIFPYWLFKGKQMGEYLFGIPNPQKNEPKFLGF